MRSQAGDAAALVADLARAWRREAGDRAKRGGLSGTVAAEEGDDLAFGEVQRHPVQDVAETVERIDIVDLENHAATPPR